MHESDGVKIVMEMAGEDMAAARDLAHFKTGLDMKETDGGAGHGQADRPERGMPSWKKLRLLPDFHAEIMRVFVKLSPQTENFK
jgi:hypothetical protein